VADEREADFVVVPDAARGDGDHLDFFDALLVRVGQQARAQARRLDERVSMRTRPASVSSTFMGTFYRSRRARRRSFTAI
jgi:hypothetical protein